jgi:transposase
VEGRDLPGHPRRGRSGGGQELLHRRGRVRSEDHAGTTWAPVGQTPVVAATGDRFGIDLISAVAAKGTLRFAAYDGHLNGPVFIDFCRRLLHDTPGPVFLVLDGHLVHRSKAVKQVAASTNGQLRLCFLPGYAPELNPDAWVGKHVKHDRIGRAGVPGPEELKAKALAALSRLQQLPEVVRSCFQDPNLRYITARSVHLLTFALVTLPRSSRAVRYCPSLQVDGSSSSADVAAERHKSERLAVNVAVSQR